MDNVLPTQHRKSSEQGSRGNNCTKKFNLGARLIGDNVQLLSQLNSSNRDKCVRVISQIKLFKLEKGLMELELKAGVFKVA